GLGRGGLQVEEVPALGDRREALGYLGPAVRAVVGAEHVAIGVAGEDGPAALVRVQAHGFDVGAHVVGQAAVGILPGAAAIAAAHHGGIGMMRLPPAAGVAR